MTSSMRNCNRYHVAMLISPFCYFLHPLYFCWWAWLFWPFIFPQTSVHCSGASGFAFSIVARLLEVSKTIISRTPYSLMRRTFVGRLTAFANLNGDRGAREGVQQVHASCLVPIHIVWSWIWDVVYPLLRTCAFWMVSAFHRGPIHLNLPRDETRLIAPLRRMLNVLHTCESIS